MADKKPPPIPPSEGPRDNQEITSFTASPSSITAGQSTTLSWVIVGSWSLHVSGSGDPAFETGTHSGSTTVSPTTTTTYQINVFHGSDLITAQVTVTVTAVVPTTASFSVSPSSISSGGYVTVYWSVSNSPDAPNVAGTGFSSPYEPVSLIVDLVLLDPYTLISHGRFHIIMKMVILADFIEVYLLLLQ